MINSVNLSKNEEKLVLNSFDQTIKIPQSSKIPEKKRNETANLLPESLSGRSKSNKNLSLSRTKTSTKSTERLRVIRVESNILPRIKRFAQFIKPSARDINELVDLLNILPTKISYQNRLVSLPKPLNFLETRKILILDLDETLAHTIKQPEEGHIRLSLTNNVHINVNIRPYAQDLLKYACRNFEVIIFTASQSKYADTILDHLDPMKQYIHHRLYRENCINFHGYYLKDLRILENRDLKDIIIVDNSLISFALQIENGVPISQWNNDLKDIQLKVLIDYLRVIKNCRDIRIINRDIFNLRALVSENIKKKVE